MSAISLGKGWASVAIIFSFFLLLSCRNPTDYPSAFYREMHRKPTLPNEDACHDKALLHNPADGRDARCQLGRRASRRQENRLP